MAPGLTGIELAITVTTLTGSLCSSIGAGFICLCYLFLPGRKHFRHRLIQNLAAADFINATNGSISGIYILVKQHQIPEGGYCVANALIAQITVQGADIAILAIALVTVLTITSPSIVGMWSTRKVLLVILSTWVLPLITGFTAFGLHFYHRVSGNWCWIQESPIYLRYVLTHGWRFLVIFTVLVLYTYLHIHLRRHFRNLGVTRWGIRTHLTNSTHETTNHKSFRTVSLFGKAWRTRSASREMEGGHSEDEIALRSVEPGSSSSCPKQKDVSLGQQGLPTSQSSGNDAGALTARRVQKILLMRAYPTLYVLLWIPGILNRIFEASGHSSNILALLQSSTQFVGFANAMTYGWNEGIARQLLDRSNVNRARYRSNGA